MTTINRRTILGGIAATAVPLPQPAAIAEPVLTPEERLEAAIAEVKAAASALMPDIRHWETTWKVDGAHGVRLFIAALDR